jgi:hypothetical protein
MPIGLPAAVVAGCASTLVGQNEPAAIGAAHKAAMMTSEGQQPALESRHFLS